MILIPHLLRPGISLRQCPIKTPNSIYTLRTPQTLLLNRSISQSSIQLAERQTQTQASRNARTNTKRKTSTKEKASKPKSKSSNSSRWNNRQSNDEFTKEAKNLNFRSRAAFKLLQIDEKFQIFPKNLLHPDDVASSLLEASLLDSSKGGDSNSKDSKIGGYFNIVDLGFAPGAWSQVAQDRTKSKATILGIDILPCIPPKGVNSMQANILSKSTHDKIRQFFHDLSIMRKERHIQLVHDSTKNENVAIEQESYFEAESELMASLRRAQKQVEDENSKLNESKNERISLRDYITEVSKSGTQSFSDYEQELDLSEETRLRKEREIEELQRQDSFKYPLNLVLSDMCAPFIQVTGYSTSTTNLPYFRMSNTSGLAFKDHLNSMDLCDAALILACDLLKPDGHMVIKFFTGEEDILLEKRLLNAFDQVKRFKPKASRSESKEAYFICKYKKKNIDKLQVFQNVK